MKKVNFTEIFAAWQYIPTHCNNMLIAKWECIEPGLSISITGKYNHLWTVPSGDAVFVLRIGTIFDWQYYNIPHSHILTRLLWSPCGNVHLILYITLYKANWNQAAKLTQSQIFNFTLKYTPDCAEFCTPPAYLFGYSQISIHDTPKNTIMYILKYTCKDIPSTPWSVISTTLRSILSRIYPVTFVDTLSVYWAVFSKVQLYHTSNYSPEYVYKDISDFTIQFTSKLFSCIPLSSPPSWFQVYF